MQHEPQYSKLKVAGVVCFYIVAALVMVIGNKAVLNHTPDLPFTFLFIQTTTAVFLFRFLAFLSRTRAQYLLPIKFELPAIDRSSCMKLLPFLFVGFVGLVFNTLCLANVDASFFQVARGLILPFTILISSLFTRKIPRLHVLLSASVVTLGFFVGVLPSLSPQSNSTISRKPLLALIYGVISSVVLSIHVVLSKVVTANYKHSVIGISYFGNLFMAVGMIPFIVLNGEIDSLNRRLLSSEQAWTTFIIGTAVTGIFGFLLGIANVLSIKVTSPVSHMFSAVRIRILFPCSIVLNTILQAAKSVIQMMLGVSFFGDIITHHRLAAIALITAGTMHYTWTQSVQHAETPHLHNDIERQGQSSEVEQPFISMGEKGGEKTGFAS
ncbi:TPT domain-containing protein [Favolaschia claudopus]|uniref:TPT domain-containing protein n=1 Tax=Favolaschia claudopus TaxID=2862362 RepID=A0AAW0C2A4_9AGAR